MSPRQWNFAATALLWAAIAGLAVACISVAVPPVYALFRWIPNGYNEGWNAYWSEVAWHGGSLYPPVDSPISNNYPPLSFYLVGALGRVVGDNIFAGRLLALVSLGVIAADVFVWLRVNRVSGGTAAFGAALFLAAFSAYAPAYIAMNDPQLLAHAVMMTGAVVLWRFDFSRQALIGAAVLMVLAGTIKHLLISMPVAVTLWIALYRRQALVTWLIAGVAVLGVGLALLYLTQGAVFFHDMASSRLYSRLLVESGIVRVWQSFGFLVVLSGSAVIAWLARINSRGMREQAAFGVLYFVIAAVIGASAAGGKGVDRNAFFDFLIAAVLAVAVGVEYVRTRVALGGWLYPLLGSAVAAGCCAVFLFEAVGQWPARMLALRETDRREAAALKIIGDIRRLGGGAAACEELSLCYWAGSAFKVDFFNYGQKLATSALPPANCAETFSAQSIALVQVNSPQGDPRLSFRLPPSCNAAIARKYSLALASSQGRLMLPAAD